MDWSFAFNSARVTLTSVIVAFLVISEHRLPVERMVELIQKDNYTEAIILWNTMSTNKLPILQRYELIDEIIEKSFDGNNSTLSSTSIKLTRFIHAVLNKYDKPQGYYKLYKVMDSKNLIFNSTESESALFFLAKYILEDKVQNFKVSEVENGELVPKGNLMGLIPSPVWAALQQRYVLLRNRKYSTYLFVDATGQMQGWNSRLTNERQAVFKFRLNSYGSRIDSIPDVLNNSLNFHIMFGSTKLGVLMRNTTLNFGNVYRESFVERETMTFLDKWVLQLVTPSAIRILQFPENAGGTGALVAEKPNVNDGPRSLVYVQFGSNKDLLDRDESLWDVINYN